MADANSINFFILQGIVGRDPELMQAKKTKTTFAVVSLATHSIWVTKGKTIKRTIWHRVTVWGDKLSKFTVKTVKPKMMVCVKGEIYTRKWTDGEGNERTAIDLKAKELTIMRQAKVFEEKPEKPEEPKPEESKDPY